MVVVELGARGIRVGLAGDWAPRAGTTHQPGAVVDWGRRAGDFRRWLQPGGTAVTRQGAAPKAEEESRDRDDGGSDEDDDDSDWGREHELYGLDLRGVDLGLVGDRVERGLREAFTK